ncbi:MAG: GNAT family N-acetyltransferase [Chloroflexi bacterium]|nr:GNAT family N-acetyltransferase [Chloroflexota bacterium]
MTFTITLSHDFSTIHRIRDEWTALQDSSDADSIYLTWQWVDLWWKHFGNDKELWLLEAREDNDNRLIGLAPLKCFRFNPKYGLSWRQLQFIGASSACEHLDFIVERGREAEVIPAFVAYILAETSRWDVLSLSRLLESSTTLEILETTEHDWKEGESRVAPYIPLPKTWDDFFMTLSKNRRKKQRRYRRRLDEEYPDNWSFDYVTDPAELDSTIDRLITLHQAKWEALGEVGAFGEAEVAAFHREVIRLFHEQGWLRLFRLVVDTRIVAVLYTYQYRGRRYDFASGIDYDMYDLIPGHLLTELAIANAIDEGQQEYDFLWGDEEYKYSWGAQDRYNLTRLVVTNPRITIQEKAVDVLRNTKRFLKKRIMSRDVN